MLFDTSASSNVIDNATSEQVVAVPAIPTGSGLTVTVYVKLSPVQPFAPIGVTV